MPANNQAACYTVNTSDQDENGEIVLKVDEDGFMKVHDAPTGFMVIKRSVFEKMMAAYPELNYISDSDYNRENKGPHYRFFDCMVDPKSKRYLSEDYTFCHLWRQIGGDVYVDVQSNLTHQGAKCIAARLPNPYKPMLPMQYLPRKAHRCVSSRLRHCTPIRAAQNKIGRQADKTL